VAAANDEMRAGMDAQETYNLRLAKFLDGDEIGGPALTHIVEDGAWEMRLLDDHASTPSAKPPVLITLPTFWWSGGPLGHSGLVGRTSDRVAGYAAMLAEPVFQSRGFSTTVGYGVVDHTEPGTVSVLSFQDAPDRREGEHNSWVYGLTATPTTDAARACYDRLVAWIRVAPAPAESA